jgi:hypothetical protein
MRTDTYPLLATAILYFGHCALAETPSATPALAPASIPDRPYVYDVSQVHQGEDPNLCLWNQGASVTILPSQDNTGTTDGANKKSATSSTLSGQFQFNDTTDSTSKENVVSLLERDPTAAVLLPQGTRTIIIDTGKEGQFNDFALKSFGAQSAVTIEVSSAPNSVNPEAWVLITSKTPFDEQTPLSITFNNKQGRYIKIAFETSKAGYVGCLRVTGKNPERMPTSVTNEDGTPLKMMSIKKVTHVNSGDLTNIASITDNDFRTEYLFDKTQPVIMAFETNNLSNQPIERFTILVNDKEPQGKITVYALDTLPRAQAEEGKGDVIPPQQFQLDTKFIENTLPIGSANFGPDGRAAINVTTPSTSQYLVSISEGANVHSVAEVYAGPQPDLENRNLQSQALLNNLVGVPRPGAARTAPQIPPASSLTP